MKRVIGVALAAAMGICLMGQAVRADDAADAKAAIKKLADAPSYTWASTTENVAAAGGGGGGGGRGGRGGRGGMPPAGKVEKDAYTSFTLTIMQQPYDVVMKGDKAVVKMTDGWKTKDDLQKAVTAAAAAGGGGGGGGFGGGAGGFGPEAQVLNQINTFKSPVTQAMEVADKMTNVKKTADGYTADMAADAAKTMATPNFGRGGAPGGAAAGGAPAFEVSGAKGNMAMTVKDGMASKVVIHIEGNISANGTDFPINRNTTIEIKDVGSTKQDIPADAKAKLDAMK